MADHKFAPSPDLLPVDEVAERLGLTPKTVKRLHRDCGLPLFQFTPGGSFFALWSEIESWARRVSSPQNGK